jgi:serine/threonine-protein kinase ATR
MHHSGKETRNKKGSAAGRFLNAHVLGMMARLTDVINDTVTASSPVQEQRRCLRAVEEMIAVGREYAQIARPQVRYVLARFDNARTNSSARSALVSYLHYPRTA